MNALQHALAGVGATEAAKERVKAYLSAEAARRTGRRAVPRLAAALACLMLVLAGVGGWQVWTVPVSYISIDVNPSIELAVNRFGRVVEATAYNDDGAGILSGLSVRGKTYADAIDALAADPLFRSYVDNGAKVVFTVVSDREEELRAGITGGAGFHACGGEYVRADAYCLEQAHANGLSVGKYYVYEELAQYGSGITLEDCHEMTIGELQQELERCSGHGSGNDGHHSGVSTQPEAVPSVSPGPSTPQSPIPSSSVSPSPAVPPSPSTPAAPEHGHGHHGSGHH